jgi:hypothetical protein
MIELDPGEREFMTEMRKLSVNSQGEEILVGLTVEETHFCIAASKRRMRSDSTPEPTERAAYAALMEKHEMARQQVLAAEHILRVSKPMRH